MKASALVALLLSTVLAIAQSQPAAQAPSKDSGPVHLDPVAASVLLQEKAPPAYPEEARAAGIEGAVVLDVLISETGEVKEATVASGNPALAQAAIDAVKIWKYKPCKVDGKPRAIQTQVVIGFHLSSPTSEPTSPVIGEVTQEKSPELSGAANPLRMRVSSGVTAGLLMKKVAPEYPEGARAMRIQGVVVLHAVIDKQGNVVGLKVVSGPDMLVASAIDAVRQWKYKPYLLKGEPIELDTTIELHYQLGR